MNNSIHNSERVIELSLAPKDYSGTTVKYIPTRIGINSLEQTVKTHNYSPIHWAGNYRKTDNFIKAVGFCLDYDGTMTIPDALAKLRVLNLNYFLVTTRSHTDDEHHFRVFVPFNRFALSYESYNRAAEALDKLLGTKCDSKVFDAARQLFGSKPDSEVHSYWNGQDFDLTPYIGKDLSQVRYGAGDWTDETPLKTYTGVIIKAAELNQKTSIYCPFHDDALPSAFVKYSPKSRNWYISCSACDKTYWKTKVLPPPEERCKGYWSHSKGIYEVGLVGGEFAFKDIGERKFYVHIEAFEKKDRDNMFQWLVENQHISVLRRVDYLGDGYAEADTYEVKPEEGIVEVRYAPLPVVVKDNDFIEDYLHATFGEHKEFIKQFLAAYTYTNHTPLPTLILVGNRGTGKNTFAEAIAEIYKPISTHWELSKEQFNPAYEKKLLIADETVTEDKRSYIELKRISGANELPVNKKFTPHYTVKNNINVIILSNGLLPIFVERQEMPTHANMNQFFVYELTKPSGPVDAMLAGKLKDRMGYYVRTMLRSVYEGMTMTTYRYGMPVPITDELRRLFNSSMSEEDTLVEKFIQAVVNKLEDPSPFKERAHITDKHSLPVSLFDSFGIGDKDKRMIVRKMQELQMLRTAPVSKVLANSLRLYCYGITPKLVGRIEKDLDIACFVQTGANSTEAET